MRIDHIDQMMRHGAALGGRWLGGADIHTAIDGHRIERNDFGADPLGERDAHGRLANGGCSGKEPAIVERVNHQALEVSLAARKSDIYTVNKTIVAVSGEYGKLIVSRPIDELEQTIADRAANPSDKSYTTKLLNGGVEAIGAKVVEEASEVVEAAAEPGEAGREHFVREVGDLVYHLLVLMRQKNCSLAELDAELARRFGVSGLEEQASRKKA
jgi:phosphoribosyl-ATP pyrophosphohydrolase